MKIKSATKRVAKAKVSSGKNLYSIKKIDENIPEIDMLDVEIISSPANLNDSATINMVISSAPVNLVRSGYEKIEIVAEPSVENKLPKKATAEQIEKAFENKEFLNSPGVKFEIDNTETIDKKKLAKIAGSSLLDIEEEDDTGEVEFTFAKSANLKLDDPKEISGIERSRSLQDDKKGILEVRLGKINENVNDKKISEISSKQFNQDFSGIVVSPIKNNFLNTSAGDVSLSSKSNLIKVLTEKTTNKGNKRPPRLLRKDSIRKGLKDRTLDPRKPFIKSVKKKINPKIKADKIKFDLPGPKTNLKVKITNHKTGKVLTKPIRQKRIQTIPLSQTYRYMSDDYLAKIEIAAINDSQAIVSITNIDKNTKKIRVYKREISRRPHEDLYSVVFESANFGSDISFIDTNEQGRSFKYVCITDDLPLYTYQIHTSKGFQYSNFEEPFLFAYQARENVVLECRDIPSTIRKLFVYRKSTAEDTEVLVDGISLQGKNSSIKMTDDPAPIEQTLRYRFVGVDENGIENFFEEKPLVSYTAKLGSEPGKILSFRSKYNQASNSVEIKGEALVDNVFIASNESEIKNPTETTLKAAARLQKIVKIQIRRINLKTEEDEIILREIINPGLSKFDTKLISLNRLAFKFSDNGENALSFGYTPAIDNTTYQYIARIIVYPLGVELRKVSDFEKIDGIRAPGRLKYNFDPIVFDHPLNVELGIMPSGANSKTYELANLIGQTSDVRVSSAHVVRSDIQDSVSIEARPKIDEQLSPVIEIIGTISSGLLDNIDHIAIEVRYDTVNTIDKINRLFLTSDSFTYYDYSFNDLACKEIGYRFVAYDKAFKKLLISDYATVRMNDPQIQKAQHRQKSLAGSIKSQQKEIDALRTTKSESITNYSNTRVD